MGQILIDPISAVSLHLEAYFGAAHLSSGTGFVVRKADNVYLVTNWHVVSGRHATTNSPLSSTGGIPNRLLVWHHDKSQLGKWTSVSYDLLDEAGNKHWIDIALPTGEMCDVVLLPIEKNVALAYYELDLTLSETDVVVAPSEPISIVGFPFGTASDGKFPIWKTGHVASDIDLSFDQKPIFLVDTTTKPGMSGSPVLARRVGAVVTSKGMSIGGSATRFMGVYSGRAQDSSSVSESNLGLVWKPIVLQELLKLAP